MVRGGCSLLVARSMSRCDGHRWRGRQGPRTGPNGPVSRARSAVPTPVGDLGQVGVGAARGSTRGGATGASSVNCRTGGPRGEARGAVSGGRHHRAGRGGGPAGGTGQGHWSRWPRPTGPFGQPRARLPRGTRRGTPPPGRPARTRSSLPRCCPRTPCRRSLVTGHRGRGELSGLLLASTGLAVALVRTGPLPVNAYEGPVRPRSGTVGHRRRPTGPRVAVPATRTVGVRERERHQAAPGRRRRGP